MIILIKKSKKNNHAYQEKVIKNLKPKLKILHPEITYKQKHFSFIIFTSLPLAIAQSAIFVTLDFSTTAGEQTL